jgi:hypothetical protein
LFSEAAQGPLGRVPVPLPAAPGGQVEPLGEQVHRGPGRRLITRSGLSGSRIAVTSRAIPAYRASTNREPRSADGRAQGHDQYAAVAAAWITIATLAPAKTVSRMAG